MKHIFTLLCLLSFAGINAQDCRNFYFVQNNKTIEMSILNKKGDVVGRNVYLVSNVSNSGGAISSNVNSEMFDKKGKTIVKSSMNVKCAGGVIMMDMKMFMPQQQAEQFSKSEAKFENVYIEYPSSMKPGDMLKDATLNMEMNNSGMQQTLNMVVYDRKVEAKESITTPAGTWECFKISSKNKMHMKMGPIGIPMNIDMIEWFAPGFGVVKTTSKNGGTLITSVK
ncbi:MAG TPA: hypothetical protein VGD17_01150 [Chitinophagaceae bacterium]